MKHRKHISAINDFINAQSSAIPHPRCPEFVEGSSVVHRPSPVVHHPPPAFSIALDAFIDSTHEGAKRQLTNIYTERSVALNISKCRSKPFALKAGKNLADYFKRIQ